MLKIFPQATVRYSQLAHEGCLSLLLDTAASLTYICISMYTFQTDDWLIVKAV